MTQSKTDSQLLPLERLVAYRVAVALRRLVVELFSGADHALRDQARRSSRSIMLNGRGRRADHAAGSAAVLRDRAGRSPRSVGGDG